MALNPEESTLYAKGSDLHAYHWEKLAQRAPEEAARAAGAQLDGGAFALAVCGAQVVVDPSARRVFRPENPTGEVGYQRALAAVVALYASLDAPESGRLVSPRELPGGQGFFRGPHAVPDEVIAKAFGADLAAFKRASLCLGGVEAAGGDASYLFRLLPKIPAQALLWLGDAELEAKAALLVDSRSNLSLPLDVLWAALNVLASDLVR